MLRPAQLLHVCLVHTLFVGLRPMDFAVSRLLATGPAWPLPRLNLHQLVMPSLARRATSTSMIYHSNSSVELTGKRGTLILRAIENKLPPFDFHSFKCT